MTGVREMDIDFYRYYARRTEAARGPVWRYNEMKSCGVNFGNFFVARHYDRYHEAFRDYRWEAEQIVAALGLDNSATVLDMGCGTGAFIIHAAPHYRKIHAVDIAEAMLGRARRKATRAGLTNIEFHRGGFLTYEHTDRPVDAVVSVLALHHLPDFWKLVGLHRLASIVRPGGRFYLRDVVFSFGVGDYEHCIQEFLDKMSASTGSTHPGARTHIRDEYSTFGWIMEGLLERAGFQIDEADYKDGFLGVYACTKKSQTVPTESLTVAVEQLR